MTNTTCYTLVNTSGEVETHIRLQSKPFGSSQRSLSLIGLGPGDYDSEIYSKHW